MSDTNPNASPIPPAPQPPYAPLPQEPPLAATPAGQRVQGWSNRVWRAFGMTPWWRLVVGGLIVIIGTALIAVPFDSIRMANKIRSQAAKDALRTSLQHEVLERGRGVLIAARSLASDESQVAEIDSAIADIEREMAKPLAVERFQGSLDELAAKIAKQTAKRDQALKRLSELATNVGKGDANITEKIRELTDEIEMLGESIQSLEEQRTEKETVRAEAAAERARLEADRARLEADRARIEGKRSSKESRDETNSTPPAVPAPPKTPTMPPLKALDNEGEITTTRIDLFGRNVLEFDNTRAVTSVGFLPGEPDAQTIRATINRDVQKFIPASISALFLTALFLFMLIARSFAGRAARGEQRAVIAESRERTESHARQLAEARLTLMRAQVEPHFLFNTLAHVQALQEIDPPQAGTMLERLISYLRAAMPSMRETKSTLGREVDVVRAYLDLLKIRMGDRLKYFINVPADMNGVSLPPTMIATLVENAIKHGLEPKKEGGSIAVQARKLEATEAHPERMEVLVADDGLGFGGADTAGTGVGLANTRERLKMLYGSQAELAVEPNAPSGVRAIIRVPLVVPETVDDVHEEDFIDAAPDSVSPFSIQVTILLAMCFGWLGVHRYYVDLKRSALAQTALGLLSIISGGLPIFLIPLGLWVVLDVVWIATREFRDAKGRRIVRLRAKDAPVDPASAQTPGASSAHVSPFTLQVTALLAVFLGVLGIHRFYVGRYRTGALQAGLLLLSIVTGGLPIFLLPLIMWVVLDVAWILSRDFRDANGRRIMRRDAEDKRSYSATQMANRRRDPSVSKSSRGIALLLAIVLGLFGAHRFYVGRVGTALAMLFTLGGLGIWWIVDIVMVACGQLKDMDGKWVSEWE
ncbi:MAG: NINE protein [Casimicrobium sp.]